MLLPTTLAAALLLALVAYTAYWDLRSRLGLAVFGVLLVVLSLVLSAWLDNWTRPRRRRTRPLLNRPGPVARLAKLVVGGLLIPLGALFAADLVELPNHRTAMSMATDWKLARRALLTPEARLGDAVLRASDPGAKSQGIRALQAMASSEAVEQLLRILREDKAALKGGSESQSLSAALASYGEKARPGLLRILAEGTKAAPREATPTSRSSFDAYFATEFEALQREIARQVPDTAAQADLRSRVELAQDELKRALQKIDADVGASQDRSLPGFVLQTFLQMGTKEDAEILAFARSACADPTWSDPVRGQALLLIAKLGDKADLDTLYGHLEDQSPLLQARAMQAIAELEAKLAGSDKASAGSVR